MRSLPPFALFPALWVAACGAPPKAPSADRTLQVIAFNVLHGLVDEDPAAAPFDRFPERVALQARELARMRPHAILLQEIALGAQDGYPDVVAELRRAMQRAEAGDWETAFGDILGSPPSRNGGSGLGQLTATRLPVLLRDNHAVVGVAAFRFRTILLVRVELGGRLVDLYNVHLQGSDNPEEASREMGDVLGYVSASSDPEAVAVIGGDFNVADDEAVWKMLRDAGFVEAMDTSGLSCAAGDAAVCTNSTIPLGEPGRRTSVRLDYVWVRGARIASGRLVFDEPFSQEDGSVLWPSDHIGVFAEIELGP